MAEENTTDFCFRVFTNDSLNNLNTILMMTMYSLSFIFILISNILMIVGLIKTNKDLSLSKRLFLCISVSDLVTGLFTVPIQISMLVNGANTSCVWVAVQAFFNAFSPSLSMLILIMITLFRYAIITKNRKAAKFTSRIATRVIFVIQIIFSIGYALWYVNVSQTLDEKHHAIFLLFTSLYVVVVVTGMVVLNVRLLFHIRATSRHSTVRHQKNISQYHSKVTKTILIISVVVIFCYLPLIIIFAVIGVFLLDNDPRSKYYHYMIPWSHLLVVYNSGMNSIVYISRNGRIIKYFKMLFFKSETTGKTDLQDNSYLIGQETNRNNANGTTLKIKTSTELIVSNHP